MEEKHQEFIKIKNQIDKIKDYLIGIDCISGRSQTRIFTDLPKTLLAFINEKINSLIIDPKPDYDQEENNLYNNLNFTTNTLQFDCSD